MDRLQAIYEESLQLIHNDDVDRGIELLTMVVDQAQAPPHIRLAALEKRAVTMLKVTLNGDIIYQIPAIVHDLTAVINTTFSHGKRDYLLVQRAVCFLHLDQIDNALADLNTALSINPMNEKALSNRGWIFFNAGEMKRALDDFQSSININPRFPLAYHNLAKTYYELQRYSEAAKAYHETLMLNDQVNKLSLSMIFDSLLYLARSFVQIAEYGNAVSASSKAIEMINEANMLTKISLNGAAITDSQRQLLKFLEQIDNFSKMNLFYIRGQAYFHMREFDEAVIDFTSALSKIDHLSEDTQPHVMTLLHRSCCLFWMKNYDDSITEMSNVISICQKNPNAFAEQKRILLRAFDVRGSAYFKENDFRRALSDFEEASTLNPESVYTSEKCKKAAILGNKQLTEFKAKRQNIDRQSRNISSPRSTVSSQH